MNAQDVVDRSRESLSAKRVFGEPVQQGEMLIIPAARVRGGGGGGTGRGAQGEGSGEGSGFGLSASPAGAFIFREGEVRWQPAIDLTKLILGAQVVAVVGLFVLGRIFGRRRRLF